MYYLPLSAGWDWHGSNICPLVTFYGVFEDYSHDVTLEFGDVAVFGCQMNLDGNHLPVCVYLQLRTWSREGLPGRGCPGCQP